MRPGQEQPEVLTARMLPRLRGKWVSLPLELLREGERARVALVRGSLWGVHPVIHTAAVIRHLLRCFQPIFNQIWEESWDPGRGGEEFASSPGSLSGRAYWG